MAKPAKKTTAAKPGTTKAKKKPAIPGAPATVTVQGRLTLDDVALRCPTGRAPRALTLMISGSEVHATCGERHPPKGQRPGRSDPQCFFAVSLLTPAVVRTIATRAEHGRPFAFRLADGRVLAGKRARAARTPPAASAGPGVSAHAARAATARAARVRTAPSGRGGGALVAGLNTVTAALQAAGQTAGAAGAAVSSTAGAVGKIADLGREGMRTGRSAIEAADNAKARRFARGNREADDKNGDNSE